MGMALVDSFAISSLKDTLEVKICRNLYLSEKSKATSCVFLLIRGWHQTSWKGRRTRR